MAVSFSAAVPDVCVPWRWRCPGSARARSRRRCRPTRCPCAGPSTPGAAGGRGRPRGGSRCCRPAAGGRRPAVIGFRPPGRIEQRRSVSESGLREDVRPAAHVLFRCQCGGRVTSLSPGCRAVVLDLRVRVLARCVCGDPCRCVGCRHVGPGERRQVLGVVGQSLLAPGRPLHERPLADHLAVVVHGPVPDPAELRAADCEGPVLVGLGVGDVVHPGVGVDLHPQLVRPEAVDHVQGGHVEVDLGVVGKYEGVRLHAAEARDTGR